MNARALLVNPFAIAALVAVAIVLLFAPTFLSMVAIWNRDATFTHGYLIPILTLWLLWRDRNGLSAQPVRPEYRVLWLIAGLLFVWLIADLVDVQVIRQGAATMLIPAALWAVLGTAWTRRALFPLLYLLFAVPFGDFMVPWLVQFTTEFTVVAVRLTGVPIFRDGSAFTLPSGNFEVVKACSGVRYLIATIALGTLFAALSYRTWRKRLLFMSICLVLPIVANGFRAFGIVMIAHYSEMQYAVGVDHLLYGWAFFGLVILLLFWIGGKFADPDEIESAPQTFDSAHAISPSLRNAVIATVLVLLLAPLSSAGIRYFVSRSNPEVSITLPNGQSGWSGPATTGNDWRPAFADHDGAARGRYRSGDGDVNVFARRYVAQSEGSNEATAALLVADEQLGLRIDGQPRWQSESFSAEVAEVVGRKQEHWRVWRWYLVDNQFARSARHAKWLELRAWLHGKAPQATVVCIATSMRDERTRDADTANALLARFVAAFGAQVISSEAQP